MFDLSHPKLADLAALEGFAEPIDLVEAYATDSIVPAICTKRHCDASADLEPDQDRGFCETCGTHTMQSALILAGMI